MRQRALIFVVCNFYLTARRWCFKSSLTIYFCMSNESSPAETLLPMPEALVLDQLKETCESIRRHNRSPEVARVALAWESRFARELGKLSANSEVQPATVAMVA